jgi:glycosyltransferase involved in cell wall biosynthesis
MHVLVTTDTLSSVWTHTRELVSGLINRGVRVTLVSFGDIPLAYQTKWMDSLQNLDYRPTAFRLDWMQDGQQDFEDSSRYLASLIKELKPDLLHLNQLCHGALPVDVPRVAVAHGDLITWWLGVHGREPAPTPWLRWYREVIRRGIEEATMLVAPSSWMLDLIRENYGSPARSTIVYVGRNPIFFNPYVSKHGYALAVGRMVDPARQVSLLTKYSHSVPVCIVDSDGQPTDPDVTVSADVKLKVDDANLSLKGPQTETQMRTLYSRAGIFVAASRYDPLGLSMLEAAFSRCAIVANDVPCHREIWGDAAIYFQENDAESLADVIHRLHQQPDLCKGYAARAFQRARDQFTASRMVDNYIELYSRVLKTQAVAA